MVIEYDEPHHDKQTAKDFDRQREIIQHLNCTFIRLRGDSSRNKQF